MRAVKMRIEGIVQGVGFRYYTYRVAKRYGIKGYVKNMPDGSVKVMAEGEESAMEKFLQEVARGPSSAVVTNVIVEDIDPQGFGSFEIRY